MKEKLTKNLALKLISLFCAFFVWLAVVNVANPTKVSTREVVVDIINESVLEQANLTYEVVGKKTATISFAIRTKDDYKVKAADFRAYADLSEMYDVTGSIPIKVEVLNNESLLESVPVVRSPEVIKINTEQLQTKEFTLKAYPKGTVGEGYQRGTITMSPLDVAVKGPTSLVGQINSVGIEFNIEGAVSDVTGTATPKYFDANGNELTELGDSVYTIGGDVSYTMQVLKVKNLPLDFVVTGEVADGYRFTGVEAAVKDVSVAGLKSDLAKISTISVQDPSMNIEGATEDKVCEIDLKNYVDSNLTIAGLDNTVITVTLKVEPLREKNFSAAPGDITLDGRNSAYSYQVSSDDGVIRIRGLKEDLDSLSTAKMNIHADVSDLRPGEHRVQAEIQLDDAFEIIEYPEITVEVTERPISETEEETDESETESDPEEGLQQNG